MLEQGESEMRVNHIMNSMSHSPLIWILLLYSLISLGFSSVLSGYHLLCILPTFTTTKIQTTLDPFWRHNPSDRGSLLKNLEYLLLLMPNHHSLIKPRESIVNYTGYDKKSNLNLHTHEMRKLTKSVPKKIPSILPELVYS
jgi:hypothetical protein